MKAKKSDRTVSNMDVLKDIRGLLSTTEERESSAEARSRDEGSSEAEIARLEEEVSRHKELVQGQQEELHRLASEKGELAARLTMLSSGKDKPMSPTAGAEALHEDIAQLEARKAELSSALSQIDGLLQFKTKELMKRIARLYQEAGQGEIALEFRRVGDDLEVFENFAYFLRALLR